MEEQKIHNGYVPLPSAKMCSDCDVIYNEDTHKDCPRCTSSFALKLVDVLDRMEGRHGARM